MEHVVEIYYRSMLRGRYTYTDIKDIALSACARMLSMDTTYLQVYIDDEYFNLPSNDIGKVRKSMIEVMKNNEKAMDFGIDELFEF